MSNKATGTRRAPAHSCDHGLTQRRLRSLLNYDPETGIFRWRQCMSAVPAGSVAGTVYKSGYIKIRVDLQRHFAHRLAWLYLKGEFPDGEIDHINGDKGDNRAANLRCVSHTLNMQNQTQPQSGKAAGSLGVRPTKGGRWSAYLGVSGKNVYLGTFKTEEAARAEYLRAKRIFHPGSTL